MSGILNESTNTQQYTPAVMINGPYTIMCPPSTVPPVNRPMLYDGETNSQRFFNHASLMRRIVIEIIIIGNLWNIILLYVSYYCIIES